MTTEPIEKIFNSKDLNIAYAKGKEEEREKILGIIEELLRVWGPFNPFAIDLKSKIKEMK